MAVYVSAGWLLVNDKLTLANQFFWLAIGFTLLGFLFAPLLESSFWGQEYWTVEFSAWKRIFPASIRQRFGSFFNGKETQEEKEQEENPSSS